MKIIDIYTKFTVPPNLQEHIIRVASIAKFIEKHWTGNNKVDWNLTKKVALLHDLGNIVVFDFEKHPEFLGKEQSNIKYWKRAQQEMISKYGSDDHETTKQMLKEIGLEEGAINTIMGKSLGNAVAVKDSHNWPLKILFYADL